MPFTSNKIWRACGQLVHACFDHGLLVRATGDIIALSPPLIVERERIDQMLETIADLLPTID